jgi:hypothetical protein
MMPSSAVVEQGGVAAARPAPRIEAVTPHPVAAYAGLPIRFEPNVGQAPPSIAYLAHGSGYAVAITEQGAVLRLHRNARLRLHPRRADARPAILAERPLGSVSNYLVGNEPSHWHSNVSNYAAVRYEQIYPGIDWVIYGNPQQLEYDFLVAPHADPRHIELDIEGARSLKVDEHGDLLIQVSDRTLRQLKPVIYQTAADGARHDIDGHYVVAHGHFAVALGDYDHSRTLIIDPTFVYSTYLGGSGFDEAAAIATDAAGNAYVVGSTSSTDFPTAQPLQSKNLEPGFPTAFIAKFNPAGTALVYATYLGGSGNRRTGNLGFCGAGSSDNFGTPAAITGNGGDGATAIAVDSAGNAYIAGFTSSSDFPTVAPLQANNHAAVHEGSNAFVAKLNAAGNALVYSTYLGGSGSAGAAITGDSAAAIAIDATGAAYVTGITMSPDFPTVMPFQSSNLEAASRPTGFVAKLNAAGSALVYSSYLGGSGGNADASVGDCANAIAVDGDGSAYVAGQTSSADFPTVTPFQSVNRSTGLGISDPVGTGFLTKLTASGSALAYSTYLGGSTSDAALAVAVDATDDAYVSGYTFSSDFPTANALQPHNAAGGKGTNAFVAKFNPAGGALIYSTYLGGSTDDQANALALDGAGNAYIAGYTYSNDFPVAEPLQAANNGAAHGAENAFISVLNANGSALEFSTYLGGAGAEVALPCPSDPTACPTVYAGDSAAAIAVDSSGDLYVTGLSISTDFPTVAAFQTTPAGIFVAKLAGVQPGAPQSLTGVAGDPPSTHVGGALGWQVIVMLGFAVALRYRERAKRAFPTARSSDRT